VIAKRCLKPPSALVGAFAFGGPRAIGAGIQNWTPGLRRGRPGFRRGDEERASLGKVKPTEDVQTSSKAEIVTNEASFCRTLWNLSSALLRVAARNPRALIEALHSDAKRGAA
jgi:hypothetical protein